MLGSGQSRVVGESGKGHSSAIVLVLLVLFLSTFKSSKGRDHLNVIRFNFRGHYGRLGISETRQAR
jgi:hypothetical protein